MLTFPEMFVKVLEGFGIMAWVLSTIVGVLYVFHLFLGDASKNEKKYKFQILIITTLSVLIIITFVAYRLQFIKQ